MAEPGESSRNAPPTAPGAGAWADDFPPGTPIFCSQCGQQVAPLARKGPCPECGSTRGVVLSTRGIPWWKAVPLLLWPFIGAAIAGIVAGMSKTDSPVPIILLGMIVPAVNTAIVLGLMFRYRRRRLWRERSEHAARIVLAALLTLLCAGASAALGCASYFGACVAV